LGFGPLEVFGAEWLNRWMKSHARSVVVIGAEADKREPLLAISSRGRVGPVYFDRFTKRYLRDDRPETARIELLSPALGDQVEAEAAVQLLGISYDPKSEALEALLENMDHLVFQPKEIWAVEEEGGFLPSIEIVRDDGTKEILTVRRGG